MAGRSPPRTRKTPADRARSVRRLLMTDRTLNDARKIRKLVREAEALADESMLAFARLKQALIAARQNPAMEVDTGQRALMRLTQAEAQALAMSTSLLRVLEELSQVARDTARGRDGAPPAIDSYALQRFF